MTGALTEYPAPRFLYSISSRIVRADSALLSSATSDQSSSEMQSETPPRNIFDWRKLPPL